MLLFIASHFTGSMFIPNCRDTNGWSLPTPKTILAALICTFYTGLSCPPQPHTSAPYSNTVSTSVSISFIKVDFSSPSVPLHLLSQKPSAPAPSFAFPSTILKPCRGSFTTHPKYLYFHYFDLLTTNIKLLYDMIWYDIFKSWLYMWCMRIFTTCASIG